jgi:MinD-like ATPase involved in chromosome partitioning or flagellar assembly
MCAATDGLPIRLIVNHAATSEIAGDVHRRVAASCQRFLGYRLRCLGWLPPAEAVRYAGGAICPFLIQDPKSLIAQCSAAIAERLCSGLPHEMPHSIVHFMGKENDSAEFYSTDRVEWPIG